MKKSLCPIADVRAMYISDAFSAVTNGVRTLEQAATSDQRTGRELEFNALMPLLPERFNCFRNSTVASRGDSSHPIVEVVTELQLLSQLNPTIKDGC